MTIATVGHVAHTQLLLAPTVAMGVLTIVAIATGPYSSDGQAVRCYWTTSSDELSDISGLSLLDCAIVMA
jgi:hypothetical protein